jgi:hypothetical protein
MPWLDAVATDTLDAADLVADVLILADQPMQTGVHLGERGAVGLPELLDLTGIELAASSLTKNMDAPFMSAPQLLGLPTFKAETPP